MELFRLETEKDSIWLVAPLIAKLSSAVQGRVLKAAGDVLETGNNFWTAKNAKERERDLQKRYDNPSTLSQYTGCTDPDNGSGEAHYTHIQTSLINTLCGLKLVCRYLLIRVLDVLSVI